VNLLSAACVENMGIDYEQYLRSFVNAVNVDYAKIRKTGTFIASKLHGKSSVRVYDAKGTDLTFSIDNRHIGTEVGTLEDCFLSGKKCEVEVPGGEVYVAPIETSANGVLVVDEFKDYKIQNLQLCFREGKVVNFKAERGSDVFRKLLDKAEGDKDRIAELGIGINYDMKLTGYRIYDEKALGTAHIAIGNNVHLGGANKASIHWDFVLYNPSIEVDGMPLMEKGKLLVNKAKDCKIPKSKR
jgi:leucyl aminopeptidase (aminopeptidase T)